MRMHSVGYLCIKLHIIGFVYNEMYVFTMKCFTRRANYLWSGKKSKALFRKENKNNVGRKSFWLALWTQDSILSLTK